jgi:exodeoxyribonuclease-3
MKIATWNINSIRVRLPHLLSWIDSAKPDVILLQEIKCLDEVFPREEIEDMGYNVYTHGQKTYNGVAILSKYPLEDVQKGIPGFEDTQARYIEGYVLGKIKIASVYVPNGAHIDDPKFIYKMNFLKALQEYMATITDTFLLGGDLNIIPFDREASNPEEWGNILGSPFEREAYFKLINLGMINTHHFKENYEYSWWDYRAASFRRNKGAKIDHFLISEHAKNLIDQVSTDKTPRGWEQPSDHTPVIVELHDA